MSANSIRELLDRELFQPLRIRASSGATYDVRNPSLVVVLQSQVLVAEPNSDRFALVPIQHVADVELIDGQARRSRRSRRQSAPVTSSRPNRAASRDPKPSAAPRGRTA